MTNYPVIDRKMLMIFMRQSIYEESRKARSQEELKERFFEFFLYSLIPGFLLKVSNKR